MDKMLRNCAGRSAWRHRAGMEQLRWIYKETLNCERNKAEDSEHEHEAKWKGNAGECPGSKER